MALGAATVQAYEGRMPTAPFFADVISFAGDGAYVAGGSAAFQAYVRAKIGDSRTVLAVIDVAPNATYYPLYDHTNDKLKLFVRATGVEAANADYSAQALRVCVLSY